MKSENYKFSNVSSGITNSAQRGKGKTDERIEKNKDHMDYIKTLAIQE